MFKTFLVNKLKGALTSSTMGVAALMALGAGWVANNPSIVEQVAPKHGGVIVAGAALLVAIARLRTL